MRRNDRFWLIMIILFALSMSGGRRPPPPPPNGDENGDTTPGFDVFGIREINGTSTGGTVWDSRHWANGRVRNLTGSSPWDPDDPTSFSRHKGSSGPYRIDGQGICTLRNTVSGGSPRFYIDPNRGGQRWLNTEFTMYYFRVSDNGASNGGMVVGVRTVTGSHDAHPSGTEHCKANTYYGRIRNTGATDYAKELIHAESGNHGSKSMAGLGFPEFSGGFPRNRWVGMKFICRNFNNNTNVLMQTYVDMEEGQNGGNWVRVNELRDTGNLRSWGAGGATGPDSELPLCMERNPGMFPLGDFTIMTGVNGQPGFGGVVFTRNGVSSDVRYKWMTVREVDPLP